MKRAIQEQTNNPIYKPTEQNSQYQIVDTQDQQMLNQQLNFKQKGEIVQFMIPETEEAQELYNLLKQRDNISNAETKGFVEQFFKKYNELSQKFRTFCTCQPKGFQITFTLEQLIILIVHWSTFFSVLSESIAIENSYIIQNDKIRQQIAHQMPVYAFLYTISSQICQQFINHYLSWIALFLVLLIIPLIVLIGYHLNFFRNYDGFSQDYIGVGYCILSIAIFINSLMNKGFFYFIKKVSSNIFAALFNCSFCVLVSYFILFKIIAFVLLIQSTQLEYIVDNITQIIAPSTFLVIFFFSIFLIKGVFYIPLKTIKYDLYQLSLNKYADDNIKNEYPNYQINKRARNLLKSFKLEYVTPLFISISYAAIECFCFVYLIYGLQSYDFEQIITFGFLLLAIPTFMILGICISNTRINKQNLYLITPLLFGALFSVMCIKVWSMFIDNQYLKSIARLIGICPLLISLMWLTVAFFRSDKKNQKLFVMLFSCFSFAIPFGIFLTFYEFFENFDLVITAIVFAVIGLIPIAFLIIYYIIIILIYLVKLPKQAENLIFTAYEYVNLSNYAVWYNAICYILSFYFICYFAWNEPNTATGTKKGTIIGLLSIHTILFILTSHALSLQAKEKLENEEQPDKTVSERFLNRIQDGTTVGIILPFIVLLPISLSVDNEVTKNALLANAIGVPLTFLYYKFQISLKQESVRYQSFIQPLVVIIGWTFIIGPIGTIFPILADYYENSSKEFAYFAQLAVAYSILIIIISVTVLSIFYSVLLNKEQLEMKKKEVLKAVMMEFSNKGVFATEEISSLLFVRYVQHRQEDKLVKDLILGDPVNMYEYNENLEDKKIKNILVTKQDYENKMKLDQIQESKRQRIRKTLSNNDIDITSLGSALETQQQQQNESTGCLSLLQDCLFSFFLCRFGFYELEQMQKNEENKKNELIELEKNKIYLEQKLQARLRTRKRHSTAVIEDNNQLDFYKPMHTKTNYVSRFWIAVYKYYKNKGDFSMVLELLALEKDIEILKQYNSFEQKNDGFTLSEEDFALLIYDNFKEEDASYIQIAQKLGISQYFRFSEEIPDFKTLIKQTQNVQSPIQEENFQSIQDFDKQRKPLFKINIPVSQIQRQDYSGVDQMDQADKLEFQRKYEYLKEQIENKYKLKNNPSQFQKSIWAICQTIHIFIWVTPKKYTQKIMNQLADLYSKIAPIIPKPNPINEEWKQIAPQICRCLVDEFNRFDQNLKNQEFHFQITVTNILAAFLRCYDIYGLITLAFDSQVGWFGQKSEFKPIKMVDYSAIWSEYNFFFFLAFVMSIAYIVLGIQASKQIADNSFGFNTDGSIAGYDSLRFWLSKTIQVISGQFIFVMKTYIDAFICDYSEYPYTLVRQPTVECMSDLHFLYITIAVLGCGIYYPLSTYLQPTFQFMDRSLDLKFKSNFVVLYIQAKLLILGSSSVFSNLQDSAYLYQMLFSFLVMSGLVYFHFKLDPSYIRWFNKVDRSLLLILCFFYFGAFVILVSNSVLAGWVISSVLTIATLGVLAYNLIKEYKYQNTPQENQVRPSDTSQQL